MLLKNPGQGARADDIPRTQSNRWVNGFIEILKYPAMMLVAAQNIATVTQDVEAVRAASYLDFIGIDEEDHRLAHDIPATKRHFPGLQGRGSEGHDH
ncbi:hypothetical protein AKL15_00740 [Corynebacterium glutamicum]|nr:hypothetical protein B7P23_12405 [Corynebacterium glutamicum]AUH99741.1 hypothetical protein CYL77_00600 [Corynebacterium glutamicum]AUI03379.1 hypothetical protein C0I99_04285 [Corynebacterium glutamicum]OKX87071.1 hypothetical protein AUO96_06380 [Corynebacterium glutamicum]QDX74389.1 hypothetical protein AKL15_00740 [Corynebacterium glutamicum]